VGSGRPPVQLRPRRAAVWSVPVLAVCQRGAACIRSVFAAYRGAWPRAPATLSRLPGKVKSTVPAQNRNGHGLDRFVAHRCGDFRALLKGEYRSHSPARDQVLVGFRGSLQLEVDGRAASGSRSPEGSWKGCHGPTSKRSVDDETSVGAMRRKRLGRATRGARIVHRQLPEARRRRSRRCCASRRSRRTGASPARRSACRCRGGYEPG
jgi:hypothetical protein